VRDVRALRLEHSFNRYRHPAAGEHQGYAKPHLGNAVSAIAESNRHLNHPQIFAAVRDYFKSNLESGCAGRRFQEQLSRHREKTAHRIVDSRDWIGRRGGHPRHNFAPKGPARRRSALHISAAHHHVGAALKERLKQIADFFRRMTQVRVHDDEPFSSRHPRSCQDRSGETERRSVALDQFHRAARRMSTDEFTGAVRRAVVDENYLVRDRVALSDPREKRRNVFGFI